MNIRVGKAKAWVTGALVVGLLATGISISSHSSLSGQQTNARVMASSGLEAKHIPVPAQQLDKPRADVLRTDVLQETFDVPYSTTQTYDGTLPKGTTVVKVEGRSGKKTVVSEVKYSGSSEASRALIRETVTVPPVAKIIAIGTKVTKQTSTANRPVASTPAADCDENYTPCVPLSVSGLGCATDIDFPVRVTGRDIHGLDSDANGIGCESN